MVSFSVIIPVYNSAPYIAETLDSFIRQSCRDFEIIVVDDGSVDDTAGEVKRNLEGKGLAYTLIRRSNGGASAARNEGFLHARGKAVAFFDGDDLADSDFVEKLSRQFKAEGVDFVFSGYRSGKRGSGSFRSYGNHYSFLRDGATGKEALRSYLRNRIELWGGAVALRRELIAREELSFTEGAFCGEDQEFWIKCLFHSRQVACIRKDLSTYVQHEGQTTRLPEHELGQFSQEQRAYERLMGYMERRGAEKDLLDMIRKAKLPHFQIKQAAKLLKMGREDRFSDLLGSEVFQAQLRVAMNVEMARLYPETFLKAMLLRWFPRIFRSYYGRKTPS